MNESDCSVTREMAWQANRDIAKRSITGSYIYLLIWFSIIIPHKFYEKSPELCLWLTFSLVTLAAARIALILNFDRIYGKSPLLWKLGFFPVVWLVALVWGIFCAMTFVLPDLDYLSLALIVSTAGLTGGGVSALVPNRILTVGLFTAFLIPGGVVILLSDTYNPSVGIIFLVYWIGMYAVTKNQHEEYWKGLNASFLLKKYTVELEHLNTQDGLTGLKNRKYFDQALGRELKRAARSQTHLSLLFIDIDHFKQINDTHGHLFGDDCLRHISSLLKSHIQRETDTIARYGGEEFAVILPDNNRKGALRLAENLRKTIENSRPSQERPGMSLTVSIGISSLVPEPATTQAAMIDIADSNLYKAKQNGRNQVVG